MTTLPNIVDQPVHHVRVATISHNPSQPRKSFDDEELLRLSESIRNHGILQPLVVRKVPNDPNFQLIAGERRLRAAHLVGLAQVPVHIVDFNDQQVFEAALAENIQRTDLNPIEKAVGFQEYLDKFQVTKDQLAAKLGMDRTTVTNIINLLLMPKEVQEALRLGQISVAHAKALKGLPVDKQVNLTKEVVLKQLSVKALELDVKKLKGPVPEDKPAKEGVNFMTPHVRGIEDGLRQRLATKFEIRLKAKDKGAMVIHFESNDDFERIVEMLQRG
jgi:ParB family transcriptional regulator, chromosome partitioning protein